MKPVMNTAGLTVTTTLTGRKKMSCFLMLRTRIKSILPLLFFFTGVLHYLQADAQALEKINFSYKNGLYDVFILKTDSSLSRRMHFADNGARISESLFWDSIGNTLKNPFFAITASITDSSCQPLGLYIRDNQTLRNINLGNGSGNFYLKPNGVFCTGVNNSILIQNAASYTGNSSASLGIQSGPLLIDNGVINSMFDKNSKNKFIRCGAGTYTDNGNMFLVFIKSVEPVSFYQLAQLFLEKFNCRNALTFESGANCSMHLPSQKTVLPDKANPVCRYLVIEM